MKKNYYKKAEAKSRLKYIANFLFAYLFTFLLFGTYSCDDVLNPEPIGISSIDVQFETPEGAVSVINGVYSGLPTIYAQYTSYAFLIEVWSDDLFISGGASDHKDGDIDPSNNQVVGLWNKMYAGIQRANVVLDRIDGVDFGTNDALREQIRGEAYFLRAFFYFHLVRLFGDVPLSLNEIVSIDEAKIPRKPISDVYDIIIDDLKLAIQGLPVSYNGNGLGKEKGRATIDAAKGLLAYVYLTIEDWNNAADLAGQVINSSNNYGLLPSYADNFNGTNENGSESLFEIQYDGTNFDFVYPFNLAPVNNIGVRIVSG